MMATTILKNLPGWRTDRHIVVIESDDWGSIRMSTKEAFETLKSKGVPVETNRYLKYDSLASQDDLSALFEVLYKAKDQHNRPAKLTAVSVVANPDFEAIAKDGFGSYHYEPFTKTLQRFPDREGAFAVWMQGMENGLFRPEFHGREHLNISRWLAALNSGDLNAHAAFEHGVFGLSPSNSSERSYMPAFDIDDLGDLTGLENVVVEGLALFEKLFGYRATHFTPPNGPLNEGLHPVLAREGIRYIQTARLIYSEPIGDNRYRRRYRFLGKKNALNQIYFTRNCVFEPSESPHVDWAGKCLREIEWIFRLGKPAIITSHRVNYIGVLDERNRSSSLRQLNQLLSRITAKWPDVEFMTSRELGELIASGS